MKTNVQLLIAIALLATACTTGSKVTSGSYSDDLYYTPGDAVPVASKPVKEVAKPQQKSTVAMQVEETDKGKVVNNYVVPKSSRKDNNAYYFDEQPAYSDTIVEYADDREQVTVNNYYEGEEMSYSTRIRTFYDPYFYDPFWDPYWSFGFGFSYGWGYPYHGYGWGYPYYGWGYPYYGYGWGYPYYGYGWGYPYYGWGYPGYGWGYPGYGWGYPGYGWGYPVYYGDVSYGRQNHTGRQGNSNAVRYGANNKSGYLGGASYGRQVNGSNVTTGSTRLRGSNTGSSVSGSTRSGVTGAASTTGAATRLTRPADTKSLSTAPQTRAGGSQRIQTGRGETITNLRRSGDVQGNNAARPASSSTRNSSGSYTPTYNRPRMNTQPSYNSGNTRQSQPYSNGNAQSRYSRPSGQASGPGSSSGSPARTQSSNSYQRGSAASSAGRSSYSGGSSGSYSGGSTRSSQSRSYDSGSGSSGRSYSSPSSSFSSGGGGNSGGGGAGTSGGGGGGTRSGGGSGRTR